MHADWLYPLSSKADYWFEYKGGRTPDTSPASFEQMVQLGGIDDHWFVYKNWRKMQHGDRLWVYYGSADGDLGVVGLATIDSITPPDTPGLPAEVALAWDLPATTRLLANPAPADEIRRFISHPQGATWAIPPTLAKRLLRQAKATGTPSKAPFGELEVLAVGLSVCDHIRGDLKPSYGAVDQEMATTTAGLLGHRHHLIDEGTDVGRAALHDEALAA